MGGEEVVEDGEARGEGAAEQGPAVHHFEHVVAEAASEVEVADAAEELLVEGQGLSRDEGPDDVVGGAVVRAGDGEAGDGGGVRDAGHPFREVDGGRGAGSAMAPGADGEEGFLVEERAVGFEIHGCKMESLEWVVSFGSVVSRSSVRSDAWSSDHAGSRCLRTWETSEWCKGCFH